MKKINSTRTQFLSLILTLGSLLFLPGHFAHANFLDDVVSGTLKAGELENYKIRQNISGTFDLEEDRIKVNYQMNIGTQVDNSCGINCKTQYEINGRIDLNAKPPHSEDMSEVMTEEELSHIQFSVSALTLNQGKEYYFKWNELKISGDEFSEENQKNMEGLLEILGNKWITLNLEDVEQWLQGIEGDLENPNLFNSELNEKILKQMEEDKNKTAKELFMNLAKTLIEDMQADNEINQEEADMALKATQILLNSKFFFIYEMNKGNEVGFKKAIFNRLFFMNALEKIGKEIGLTLGKNERDELAAFLQKMKLSFIYRFDTTGLMDIFSAHFEWKDEAASLKFNLNYHQQIWGQGQARVMEKPKEVMRLEEWIDLFSPLDPASDLNSTPTYPPVEIETPADLVP